LCIFSGAKCGHSQEKDQRGGKTISSTTSPIFFGKNNMTASGQIYPHQFCICYNPGLHLVLSFDVLLSMLVFQQFDHHGLCLVNKHLVHHVI
jgi:hypothetical protein